MREIKEIHIHCTATREGKAITAEAIRQMHKARGWSDIGYHIIVGFQGVEHLSLIHISEPTRPY